MISTSHPPTGGMTGAMACSEHSGREGGNGAAKRDSPAWRWGPEVSSSQVVATFSKSLTSFQTL